MALLEIEAIRFAEVLDDIDQLSVTDIGGGEPDGFWLVVRDGRFDIAFEISSWIGYWELIGALADYNRFIDLVVREEMS